MLRLTHTISKRRLLRVQELIKYTSEGHVDKEGVTVALSIIASIAKEIDRYTCAVPQPSLSTTTSGAFGGGSGNDGA